jgi:hypothetical protein
MPTLTTLPPELRNEIYDLLLVPEEPILIVCPRKNKKKRFWGKLKTQAQQRHTNFASLLRVDKQISHEAKTFFYACNTFIIGNGYFGSTRQVNVRGFQKFIARVPKDCLGLIPRVELDMLMLAPNDDFRWARAIDCWFLKWKLDHLEEICDGLLKHFRGLESVSVAVLPLYSHELRSRHKYVNDDLRGDFAALSAPIQNLLALPSLEQLHIKFESARNIRSFVEAVLEGKEEARDVVKMVKRDGSFVPF